MKLEVGMYIRTKNGVIARITNILEDHTIDCDNVVFDDFLEIPFVLKDEYIADKNHNILELLKPEDLMYIDISPDDCGGIIVPRIAETMAELKSWKEHLSTGYWILKGVVTREQLWANVYKVGEWQLIYDNFKEYLD